MVSRGSVVEGGENLSGGISGRVRSFEYAILVDETNDHALEAEKYDDGTLIVYSTVYRPATDIGEISSPSQGHRLPHNNNTIPKLNTEEDTEKKIADIITIVPVPAAETSEVTANESKAEENKEVKTDKNSKEESKKETVKAEANKTDTETSKQPPARDLMAMDAKLAVRVINEAQSSNISMAALIRKVIDLPAKINNQVMVDFALSEAEYTELAKRYNLEIFDYAGVKENIVKELQQFVGNKK
jgi:hypothetical protein